MLQAHTADDLIPFRTPAGPVSKLSSTIRSLCPNTCPLFALLSGKSLRTRELTRTDEDTDKKNVSEENDSIVTDAIQLFNICESVTHGVDLI